MDKHTPGPWEVTKGKHVWEVWSHGDRVASVFKLDDEGFANASLVAQAPVVWHALGIARFTLAGLAKLYPGTGRSFAVRQTLKIIDEAIAENTDANLRTQLRDVMEGRVNLPASQVRESDARSKMLDLIRLMANHSGPTAWSDNPEQQLAAFAIEARAILHDIEREPAS